MPSDDIQRIDGSLEGYLKFKKEQCKEYSSIISASQSDMCVLELMWENQWYRHHYPGLAQPTHWGKM